MYSEKVIELSMSPQNVGNMLKPDGEGAVGDINCGDALTIYVKVEFGIIIDVSCQVYGGTALLAACCMTTILTKGKTLEEALRLTDRDVLDALGGLPKAKQYCAKLAVSALQNAVEDYLIRRGMYGIIDEHEDSKIYSSSK
jgi:nitrogen fixation NifU-like protein